MKLILLSAFLCSSYLMSAQSDSVALKAVENKLKNKASVSSILVDKAYVDLHPITSFRELIRKYANSQPLAIATSEEPGKRIKVIGTISNEAGKPVADALVYLYQTDAKGWYAADAPHVLQNEGDMRHARLFGYVKTDAAGRFELNTIKPSGYPQSDLPAHIHVHVWASGYDSFVNEFLFDDDERLVGNIRQASIRNNFMIAKPEKASSPFEQQFSYGITLKTR